MKNHPKRIFKKFKWGWLNREIARAERQSGWPVDVVLFSWFDGMRSSVLGTLIARFVFNYRWVGLYFCPSHFRPDVPMKPSRRLRKKWMDKFLLQFGRCIGIGIFDEGVQAGLAKGLGKFPVVFFPEITETGVLQTATVDAVSRQAGERCIFALLGDLFPRKGVMNFLRLANELDPSQSFFLMAGTFELKNFPVEEHQEIRELLRTAGRDNCYFRLERIENALEFNALVSRCDVLYLVYQNFYHSSGLLAKAALFHKPVIVSKGYCIGERVEKYKLGVTVDEGDYAELLAASKKLTDTAFHGNVKNHADFDGYNVENTVTALGDALQELLALG
jgi:hypothetical protein